MRTEELPVSTADIPSLLSMTASVTIISIIFLILIRRENVLIQILARSITAFIGLWCFVLLILWLEFYVFCENHCIY